MNNYKLNYSQLSDKKQLNSDKTIQNFVKMIIKEIESTTQNINESIFEEDLIIVIDELINLYFNEINKGKDLLLLITS